jgi:hypothetical protein
MSTRTASLLASFLLLGSCTLLNDPGMHMGNVRDTSAVDAARVVYDDFCNELAAFGCEAAERCCTAVTPGPSCVADLTESCDASLGRTLFRDRRAGYDEIAAARALEEARTLGSTCDPGLLTWYRTLASDILAGSRVLGAECTPEPMDGGFDVAAFYSCTGDNACIYGGIDRWNCLPRAGMGAGCLFGPDCQDGLYCAGPFGSGTCQPRLPVGAVCSTTGDGEECQDICVCDAVGCATAHCVAPTSEAVYCNVFTR